MDAFDLVEIKKSSIHGLGVFAKVIIYAGTVWWQVKHNNTLIMNRSQYECFDASIGQSNGLLIFRDTFNTYSFYSKQLDSLVFILDKTRNVNHSRTPNSVLHQNKSIALRDIYPGEEITEDYYKYDQCEWAPIMDCMLGVE
jgi:SET domain-containing protein